MPAAVPRSRQRSALFLDDRPRILGTIEPRRFSEPGRLTLEQRIHGTWTQLVEAGAADCPVCAGKLIAGSGCTACGSALT